MVPDAPWYSISSFQLIPKRMSHVDQAFHQKAHDKQPAFWRLHWEILMSGPTPADLRTMGKMKNFRPSCHNGLRSSSKNVIVQGLDGPSTGSTMGEKTDSGKLKEI